MNNELKQKIDHDLFEALFELSKQDIVINNCLSKSENEFQFINSLMAALICIADREIENISKIETLLKSNPQIIELLKAKDDTTVLPESS